MNELEKELQRFRELRENAEGDTSFFDATIADLEKQLGIYQEREQMKANDLEDIQLPQDYNEIFGDPRANDEIASLIRQAKEQLWERHNNEIAELDLNRRTEVADLKQKLAFAEAQAENMLAENKRLSDEIDNLEAAVRTVTELKEDAENKRDAAAREIESLKGQVNELEQSLKYAKKPVLQSSSTFSLTLKSSIQPETAEEKAARLKQEELERLNRNLRERGVTPLPMPEFTSADVVNQSRIVEEAAKEAERFQDVVQGDGAGQAPEDGTGEALGDVDAEKADIEARFRRIEEYLGLKTWRSEGA